MSRHPYEEQYLDNPRRSVLGWFLWIVFRAPGKAILWWEYMFPKRGQVYASGRRYGNSIVEILTSIGFWFAAAYSVVLIGTSIIDAKKSGHGIQRPPLQTNIPHSFDQSAPPPLVRSFKVPSITPPEMSRASEVSKFLSIEPQRIAIVTAFANLRASARGSVIDQVDAGEHLAVLETNGSWVKVRKLDGVIGWIHQSVISMSHTEQ